METVRFNIVDDILKSRIALHDFGQPVNKVLKDKLEKINSPTLFILNLRNVNPMDYEFVNISFNETIRTNTVNDNLYLAFLVDSGEFDELCTGILDILGLKFGDEDTEQEILVQNGFSMVYRDELENTKYLTSLTDKHLEILDYIDSSGEVQSGDILSRFGLNAEDTTSILEDLKKSKFILQIEGPKYLSIKSFIY